MKKKLKLDYKALMIDEAGFIYSLRHGLNNETFFDEVFMTEEFDCEMDSEFDNICIDLRLNTVLDNYTSKEITQVEYDLCVDRFGSN
jgi:hypothetical protein